LDFGEIIAEREMGLFATFTGSNSNGIASLVQSGSEVVDAVKSMPDKLTGIGLVSLYL